MNLIPALGPWIFLGLLLACQPAKKTDLVFGGAVGESPVRAPAGSSLEGATAELQMADRSYVESVLFQVFDAAGTVDEALVRGNIYQRSEFGGPCDPYAASDSSATLPEFPKEDCFTGMGDVLASTNNPMRSSLTAKVCEKLVKQPARWVAVSRKIFSNGKFVPPDAGNLKRAHALFYPVGEMSGGVQEAFRGIYQAGSSPEEGWRAIVLTLCLSPEWQVY